MSATHLTLLKLCICFLHDMRMCMWFAYNCCISFCQFSPFIYRLCEHVPYNTIPILCPLLKLMLHLCPHPPPSKIVTFSALETSHSLACTFYEFVTVCRCFYATNENIHVLSVKFPHLFLRPEIIITFLWGWEWSGGQVRHRSPRNSGF